MRDGKLGTGSVYGNSFGFSLYARSVIEQSRYSVDPIAGVRVRRRTGGVE